VHDHAEFRVIVITLDHPNFRRGCGPIIERYAALPLLDLGIRHAPMDGHFVSFWMLEAWMGQLFGQFAIVGHQDQPLRVSVEAANREDVPAEREQFANGALFVARIRHIGGDHVHRLIERDIDAFLGDLEPRSVDADIIHAQVCPVAEDGNPAIHGYATLRNILFRLTARTNPGLGHQFLQTFCWHCVFRSFVCPFPRDSFRVMGLTLWPSSGSRRTAQSGWVYW
jgi:hypothetical protein